MANVNFAVTPEEILGAAGIAQQDFESDFALSDAVVSSLNPSTKRGFDLLGKRAEDGGSSTFGLGVLVGLQIAANRQ